MSVSYSSEAGPSKPKDLPKLPPIQKGASLVIAYRLENRPVLLIGGGVIAAGRLFYLLEAGAEVTVVAPAPLDLSIQGRLDDITWYPRSFNPYNPEELKVEDFAMVLTAIDDVEVSRRICQLCREKRVPVNVADIPPSCDFYFGAQLRRGPLQVLVSTGGAGPKIGAMVRDMVEDALPDNLEDAIEGVGLLRSDLRGRAVGVGGEIGRKRMKWMIGICEAWGLDQMGSLKQEKVRKQVLDEGWDKNEVIRPDQLGLGRSNRRSRDKGPWNTWTVGIGGLITGIGIGAVVSTMMLKRLSR